MLVDEGDGLPDIDLERRRAERIVVEDADDERPGGDGAGDLDRVGIAATSVSGMAGTAGASGLGSSSPCLSVMVLGRRSADAGRVTHRGRDPWVGHDHGLEQQQHRHDQGATDPTHPASSSPAVPASSATVCLSLRHRRRGWIHAGSRRRAPQRSGPR